MGNGGVYSPGSDGKYHASSGSSDYDYNYDDYEDDYKDDYNQGRTGIPTGQYLQGYDYNSNPYGNQDYNDVGRNGGGGGYRYPQQQPVQSYDYHSPSSSDYSDFNNYDPYRYYEGLHSRGGQKPYSQGYGNLNDESHPLEHFYY